ncbi:MAG: retropepsin-like aspartic protease family protein [Burkholderiaceae bacterium]
MLLVPPVLTSGAHAATLSVVGLFPGKAVVAVDGAAPRSVAIGESVAGYKLLAIGADSATFLVDGKRQTFAMGSFFGGRTSSGSANSRASAMLAADSRGHYMADGAINGVPTRFLVDTGATLVVLSANEANRLGIRYREAPQGMANTANGAIPYRIVKLDRVKVGDVELNNVEAGVMEGGYDGPSLLGMSFLSRTEVSRDGQSMVLTKRF